MYMFHSNFSSTEDGQRKTGMEIDKYDPFYVLFSDMFYARMYVCCLCAVPSSLVMLGGLDEQGYPCLPTKTTLSDQSGM